MSSIPASRRCLDAVHAFDEGERFRALMLRRGAGEAAACAGFLLFLVMMLLAYVALGDEPATARDIATSALLLVE